VPGREKGEAEGGPIGESWRLWYHSFVELKEKRCTPTSLPLCRTDDQPGWHAWPVKKIVHKTKRVFVPLPISFLVDNRKKRRNLSDAIEIRSQASIPFHSYQFGHMSAA